MCSSDLVLYVVIASLLIGLGARLWFVQIMSGTAYASQAKQEQTENVIVPSVRGEIVDDTGSPMVDNRSALVVSVNMAQLVQQQDTKNVANEMVEVMRAIHA